MVKKFRLVDLRWQVCNSVHGDNGGSDLDADIYNMQGRQSDAKLQPQQASREFSWRRLLGIVR